MNRKLYDGKARRGANQTIKLLRHLPIYGTVLDIGCNEGLVAEWLIQHGAEKVLGFEPQPEAFQKAWARGQDCGFDVLPTAVMVDAGTVRLRTNAEDARAGYFCNSTVDMDQDRRDSIYVEVQAVEFAEVLKELQPQGIKIDVEGSEYDLLLRTDIPPCVEWICVEVHWLKGIGAYLLPFVVQRMRYAGLGIQKWPAGLKIKDGIPDSFQPFEVMNFQRGTETAMEDGLKLSVIMAHGRNLYRRNRVMTRLPSRQNLVDYCYGGLQHEI